VKIQIFLLGISFLLLNACGEKDGFDVPMTTTTDTEESSEDCPSEWTEEDGFWLDPSLCVAWSERSSGVTWNDAKSYCSSLSAGDRNDWGLPTGAELNDLAIRNPPFSELEGDLWSSTIDSTGLINTVNLEQPGMTILLDPDAVGFVRCISP
jgi:hypothetical protein